VIPGLNHGVWLDAPLPDELAEQDLRADVDANTAVRLITFRNSFIQTPI
jgi:hypothetical protein